jgi:hypothetical protein
MPPSNTTDGASPAPAKSACASTNGVPEASGANGAAANGGAKPERAASAELASLQALLAEVQDVPDDAADEDIAVLLRRLEQADGVGCNVEGRLDAILGRLDGLLGALEPANSADAEAAEETTRGGER